MPAAPARFRPGGGRFDGDGALRPDDLKAHPGDGGGSRPGQAEACPTCFSFSSIVDNYTYLRYSCLRYRYMRDPKPESLLPLPAAVFHILIALADRDRHGYSIMQDVSARTEGKVRLSAGTLYSAVRRMLEQGLIEELAESPDPSSRDERRRYYRLTRFGRRTAAAEEKTLNPL